jgi:hypothetical protein
VHRPLDERIGLGGQRLRRVLEEPGLEPCTGRKLVNAIRKRRSGKIARKK